jgi:hypothetical protein
LPKRKRKSRRRKLPKPVPKPIVEPVPVLYWIDPKKPKDRHHQKFLNREAAEKAAATLTSQGYDTAIALEKPKKNYGYEGGKLLVTTGTKLFKALEKL